MSEDGKDWIETRTTDGSRSWLSWNAELAAVLMVWKANQKWEKFWRKKKK